MFTGIAVLQLAQAGDAFAFAGDSPNDAPMFGYFRNSVGVANVRRYEAVLVDKPAFITRGKAGTGFAELVTCLLGG